MSNETNGLPGEDDEFARMLEASLTVRSFEEGETVEGVVIAIWPDVAFLDIGGKSEATIEIEELRDPEGDLEVEVGDRIQAIVVSADGELRLSRRLARGAALAARLSDAYRAGLPVEGRVEKVNRGGYEVRVGGSRAFCPLSQIDNVRGSVPESHVGKVYTFRIVEMGDGGKNVVVSRRALLEEDDRERAESVRKEIVPGAVLPGRVVSVRDFGAFVDLGAGVQGLLHVSEMGWARIADPSAVVTPGDEIIVKVLRVDSEQGKISLGLKQLQEDPWAAAAETYAAGQVHEGRVIRISEFGAFVELAPGIDALAHVSTFPPTGKPDGWMAALKLGMHATVEILSVDFERKRIGVALVEEGSTRAGSTGAASGGTAAGIQAGAKLRGKVERHERYGVFVFLAPGRTGLMPLDETGLARGADLKKAFPIGSEVEVMVLEIDPDGRRMRLSCRAVTEAAERGDAREFTERQSAGAPESFGSLADKLRNALGPKPDR